MKRNITKYLINTLVKCFREIDEFHLSRDTQSRLVSKCESLFKERDLLKSEISKFKSMIVQEKPNGGRTKNNKR